MGEKKGEKEKKKKCSGREPIPDPLARKTKPLSVEPPDPTHKDRDTFRYWCYQQGPLVWLGSRDRSLLGTNGVFLFRDSFSLPVVHWSRGLPFGRGRCKSTRKTAQTNTNTNSQDGGPWGKRVRVRLTERACLVSSFSCFFDACLAVEGAMSGCR